MQTTIAVYKPIGITPLQVIEELRKLHQELEKEKITYAGRLDPLARGVLLLLIGDETKNREKHLGLTKAYDFEIIFGLETDTYDFLGLLKQEKEQRIQGNVNIIVNTFVHNKLGKSIQQYPPYSSKTIKGKPLYWWAKNKKLHEIEIPSKEIEIFTFQNTAISVISRDQLQAYIYSTIAKISGDFRQEEILLQWKEYFDSPLGKQTLEYQTAKFTLSCSSGTYIRSLAHDLGKIYGTGAITLDILRTKVGEYELSNAIKITE